MAILCRYTSLIQFPYPKVRLLLPLYGFQVIWTLKKGSFPLIYGHFKLISCCPRWWRSTEHYKVYSMPCVIPCHCDTFSKITSNEKLDNCYHVCWRFRWVPFELYKQIPIYFPHRQFQSNLLQCMFHTCQKTHVVSDFHCIIVHVYWLLNFTMDDE